MSTRQPPAAEFDQITAARDQADRAYNQALTVLDRAIVQKPELPHAAAGFDDSQISPLNASWRLVPDEGLELGPWWRRRLNGFVWRLIGPVIQRQQRFNALLVDHLNRDVRAATESQATAAGLVKVLDNYLEALTTFQSRLIQYLQQITPYVDTKDRCLPAGLGAALNRTTDELQKRAEQINLLTASMQAMKREIQRLRVPPHEPADRAVPGHSRPTATFDAYKYVCFEDLFRGPREAITGRQRTYLPYFEGRRAYWTLAADGASSSRCCSSSASTPVASTPMRRRSSAAVRADSTWLRPMRSSTWRPCQTRRSAGCSPRRSSSTWKPSI